MSRNCTHVTRNKIAPDYFGWGHEKDFFFFDKLILNLKRYVAIQQVEKSKHILIGSNNVNKDKKPNMEWPGKETVPLRKIVERRPRKLASARVRD